MKKTFVPLILIALISFVALARAEVWESFRGKSGMFVVQFPSKPEMIHTKMRVSPSLVLHHEEMRLAEKIPMTDKEKHYLIHLDQSYGLPIRVPEKIRIHLDDTAMRYKAHYEKLGGKVTDSFDIDHRGIAGKELWVELPEKDGEKIGIRARFYINNLTKIQQMVIAPVDYVGTASTAQFFGQLSFFKGEHDEPGTIEQDWMEYPIDTNGYFTFLLPKVAHPYLSKEPELAESGTLRTLSAHFFDPVYNESILFRAYLYDFGKELIRETGFNEFVFGNHVNSGGVQRPIAAGEFRGKRYWFKIMPPPGFPDINYKFVKSFYINNFHGRSYIIVVETMSSESTIRKNNLENMISNSFNIERQAKAGGLLVGGGEEE